MARTASWSRDVGRLALLYLAAGLTFAPWAAVYAVLRVYGDGVPRLLTLVLFGSGLASALLVWRRVEKLLLTSGSTERSDSIPILFADLSMERIDPREILSSRGTTHPTVIFMTGYGSVGLTAAKVPEYSIRRSGVTLTVTLTSHEVNAADPDWIRYTYDKQLPSLRMPTTTSTEVSPAESFEPIARVQQRGLVVEFVT